MSSVCSRACVLFVVVGGLVIGGCGSPSVPSEIASVTGANGGTVGQSSTQDVSPRLTTQRLSDVTLAKAGWTCFQPGNGLTLCAPPGTGVPPLPPTGEGKATYDLMAFTLDHQFVHHIKLLRPDLYHGEPCLGGDPWSFLAIVGYYECIIPANGVD
jgi:hypothetical protein